MKLVKNLETLDIEFRNGTKEITKGIIDVLSSIKDIRNDRLIYRHYGVKIYFDYKMFDCVVKYHIDAKGNYYRLIVEYKNSYKGRKSKKEIVDYIFYKIDDLKEKMGEVKTIYRRHYRGY